MVLLHLTLTHPEYVVPKSTPTMILSDVTWILFSKSPLPLTTGVGAEKLTLGPAIGKRCFYGSIKKRESERRRRSR
jgi:hypothetical protein